MCDPDDMSDDASSSSMCSATNDENMYWTCCFLSYKTTIGCIAEMQHSSEELDCKIRESWEFRHVPHDDDSDE